MSEQKMLLILDVDETLIYAVEQPMPDRRHDFRVGPYYVYRRPHLTEFLSECARFYDLAIWSAGSESYVAAIVSEIMPRGIQPRVVWSADKCVRRFDDETREESHLKDLKKVKRLGFDLNRVLIVDDTPLNLRRNYG